MNGIRKILAQNKAVAFFYAWRIQIICVSLSLIGLQQRFARLAGRELWNDELYQYKYMFMNGHLKPFWLHETYGDFSSFPGDYLLSIPFIRLFGLNKWGIMIPHILIAAAGFVILYFLCRRYFHTALAFFVTFAIVALNKNLVYHAFEFRPYGVIAVLALGGFLCLDLLFSDFKRLGRGARVLIAFFLGFTVIFHVYGFVFLSLLVFYQLLSRRKELLPVVSSLPLIRYLLTLFAVLFAIWLWYAAPNLGIFGFQQNLFEGALPVFGFIPNPVEDAQGFMKAIGGNLIGFSSMKWSVLGLAALAVPWNDQRWKQTGFLFLVVVLGIEIVLMGCLSNRYWFLQRQFSWVMGLSAFLLGWLWDSFLRGWQGPVSWGKLYIKRERQYGE